MNEYHVEQIVECGVRLHGQNEQVNQIGGLRPEDVGTQDAVSYTHLTLPTTPYV